MGFYPDQPEEAIGGKSLGDAGLSALHQAIGGELRDHPGKGTTNLDLGMHRLTHSALELGMPVDIVKALEMEARLRFHTVAVHLDSPIEKSMAAALITGRWAPFGVALPAVHLAHKGGDDFFPTTPVIIIPQFGFARMRIDLCLVVSSDEKMRFVAVECDGAAFHQDPIQDRKRDGYLASWGIRTFRFSGKRLHENAIECADEVIDAVTNWRFSGEF